MLAHVGEHVLNIMSPPALVIEAYIYLLLIVIYVDESYDMPSKESRASYVMLMKHYSNRDTSSTILGKDTSCFQDPTFDLYCKVKVSHLRGHYCVPRRAQKATSKPPHTG